MPAIFMTAFFRYKGYNNQFIKGTQKVPLPQLRPVLQNDCAPVKGNKTGVVNYINYSVVLSASRGFPYFTASNINGRLFKRIDRTNRWRKDKRISTRHQWGSELYSAAKSDFDKGHMTRREDVQWAKKTADAVTAADSTFFYTNAVPQHARLNQQVWRNLEDYILHKETEAHGLKACVFTGPVLSKKDPVFVTPVKGQKVQLPTLFWKVVVFPKSDGKLYRAGFMMSQESLLHSNRIVKKIRNLSLESLDEEDSLFGEFEEAATYQTSIKTIERLTGMVMPPAVDIYRDKRSVKLTLRQIDISLESVTAATVGAGSAMDSGLDFEIDGLRL
jgi:endonuclease G, mitochondrial